MGPYFLGNLARGDHILGGAKFPGTPGMIAEFLIIMLIFQQYLLILSRYYIV